MTKNTKHQSQNPGTECADDLTERLVQPVGNAAPTTGLVVVSTPIGNLGDLSPRAKESLVSADVIACEDTRRTGALCHKLGIETGRVVVHDHNERDQIGPIVSRIRSGETVALVSDAGTPGISDPGHHLIGAVIDAGLPVTAIPGPVAAIMALTLSGLPTDRFTFEGFLPRKRSQRDRRLTDLANEPRTMIFYVAPHRASEEIEAMATVFGHDRPACLARELTKLFEEFIRMPLGDLAQRYALTPPKGEVVIVVGGAKESRDQALDPNDLKRQVDDLVNQGMRRKDAAKQVAKHTGLSAKSIYEMTL